MHHFHCVKLEEAAALIYPWRRERDGLLNLAVNMLIHPEYEQWIFEFLIEYPTTLSYVFKDKGREKSAIFTKFSYI